MRLRPQNRTLAHIQNIFYIYLSSHLMKYAFRMCRSHLFGNVLANLILNHRDATNWNVHEYMYIFRRKHSIFEFRVDLCIPHAVNMIHYTQIIIIITIYRKYEGCYCFNIVNCVCMCARIKTKHPEEINFLADFHFNNSHVVARASVSFFSAITHEYLHSTALFVV